MQERRRTTRLGSWLHAVYTVPGTAAKPSNALVRTTSEGGISFFAERAFEPGTLIRVELHVPDRRPIPFTAEARWSKPLILAGAPQTVRAHETGMEFREVTSDDRKAVLLHTVLSPPTTTT